MSKEYQDFMGLLEEESSTAGVNWKVSDYLRNPERTTEFFEKVLLLDLGGYRYAYYTAIADNPNVTQPIINKLVNKAAHRWEWRALSGYYRRLAEKQGVPLSSEDYHTPLLDGSELNKEQRLSYLYNSINYMAEDLWHDLATRKLIQLGYQMDSYDGDNFGPVFLFGTSTEYLLSPGYDCAWIEKHHSVDIGFLVDDSENLWEQSVEYEGDPVWASDLFSDYAEAAVFARGIASGDILKYDAEQAQKMLAPLYSHDEQYGEVDIEILDFPYAGLRYEKMNSEARFSLVKNLIAAHEEDQFFNRFRLVSHILNLIAIHPTTEKEILDVILKHTDVSISETSKTYIETTRQGVVIY